MSAHAALPVVVLLLTPVAIGLPSVPGETGAITFRDLGFGNVTLTPADPARVLNLSLSGNASQGPDLWHIVHLDAEILLNGTAAAEAPSPASYVSASLNTFTFASLKIVTLKARGALEARWEFVNITGVFAGTSAGPRLALSLSNFPQVRAVRPGAGEMELRLENAAAAGVERVTLLDTSSVEVTRRAPPRLRIATIAAPAEVAEGEAFTVSVLLENQGGFPVKNTRVRLLHSSTAFELVSGDSSARFDWIEGREAVNWTLRAREAGPGNLRVAVQSESGDSSPTAEVGLMVKGRGPGAWTAIAIVVLGGIAGYGVVKRMRRGR